MFQNCDFLWNSSRNSNSWKDLFPVYHCNKVSVNIKKCREFWFYWSFSRMLTKFCCTFLTLNCVGLRKHFIMLLVLNLEIIFVYFGDFRYFRRSWGIKFINLIRRDQYWIVCSPNSSNLNFLSCCSSVTVSFTNFDRFRQFRRHPSRMIPCPFISNLFCS